MYLYYLDLTEYSIMNRLPILSQVAKSSGIVNYSRIFQAFKLSNKYFHQAQSTKFVFAIAYLAPNPTLQIKICRPSTLNISIPAKIP